MGKQATQVTLEDRASALKEGRGEAIPVEEITNVVGSLVAGTVHDDGLNDIATELRELLQYIGAAKSELVGMQPKSLSNRDIPDASEHLDAIVNDTEKAADVILTSAEIVGEVADSLDDDVATKLSQVSVDLFQASSFQDLTGQRITKVTKTLAHLEARLNALADAIGDDYVQPKEEDPEKDDEGVVKNETELLHGPQLEGEGNTQAEIDAILASFD